MSWRRLWPTRRSEVRVREDVRKLTKAVKKGKGIEAEKKQLELTLEETKRALEEAQRAAAAAVAEAEAGAAGTADEVAKTAAALAETERREYEAAAKAAALEAAVAEADAKAAALEAAVAEARQKPNAPNRPSREAEVGDERERVGDGGGARSREGPTSARVTGEAPNRRVGEGRRGQILGRRLRQAEEGAGEAEEDRGCAEGGRVHGGGSRRRSRRGGSARRRRRSRGCRARRAPPPRARRRRNSRAERRIQSLVDLVEGARMETERVTDESSKPTRWRVPPGETSRREAALRAAEANAHALGSASDAAARDAAERADRAEAASPPRRLEPRRLSDCWQAEQAPNARGESRQRLTRRKRGLRAWLPSWTPRDRRRRSWRVPSRRLGRKPRGTHARRPPPRANRISAARTRSSAI